VVQIFCAWAPMTAALLLYGNHYHWIFAGLLVPSFFGLKFIAERLRRTLLDAVIASRDMTLLATRFDTALNNMPHGLCMFDSERRIVVSNQKLNQQLGLPPDFELKGFSLRELVESVAGAGQISDVNASSLIERLDARLSGSEDSAFDVGMESGRTLEFTMQPMENGGMVILVEDITERRIAEAKINHLERFDALTGLPNRTILRDRMERALSEWRPDNMCAIHFVDLDQFKQVNDTLGHTRGDMLLQAVAERLQSTVRDADVIARFGGDEFVILQAPIHSLEQGEALASRLLNAVTGTYDLAATRSWLPPASASRWRRPASTRTSSCATPTWRCTGRRPRAAAHGVGSRPRWKPTPWRGATSNWICATRSRARRSSCTTSHCST
jgi:diguanylate cyclase (GGDEF)-like protein